MAEMYAGHTKAAPVGLTRAGKWTGPVLFGVTAFVAAWIPMSWGVRFSLYVAGRGVGIDYWSFVDEGRRLLERGSPYLPYQLAGPYSAYDPGRLLDTTAVPFLYPPPYALVGVAAGMVPWVLWWAIPLGLLAAEVIWWRPAMWTWPLIALALAWPHTPSVIAVGGSTMWVAALVAAGLRWGWPGALILVKPSFVPFALIDLRRRSWWVAVAVLGIVSLAMLPLWGEYLAAVRNVTDVHPWYSLGDLPFVLLPVVAWAGRRR